MTRYKEVVSFIEANHRNPSKYAPEEKLMIHFLKRGRKLLNAGELKEPRLGMSVFSYSDFLTNLFTRSSTIRKYFLFILSFRKLFPISFAASSGTSIYLSSTLLIRASVNPICAPNRSKSKRHGWLVLSSTSLFSMSGDKPPSSPKSSPFTCRLVFNRSYAGASL